jgi:hypothetical protein
MVAVTLYLCSGRLDRPLAAFPSTIVDVSETATVASVLQEAGADQFNTFQLVTDDLRADVTPRVENDECFGIAINLAGVGEGGRFQYSGPNTTVGDLRRACEHGIFSGDPRTWIVHRESGAAGGWPLTDSPRSAHGCSIRPGQPPLDLPSPRGSVGCLSCVTARSAWTGGNVGSPRPD